MSAVELYKFNIRYSPNILRKKSYLDKKTQVIVTLQFGAIE